jgi:hypothetical protein
MPATLLIRFATVSLALLVGAAGVVGQSPSKGKGGKGKSAPALPDEEKEILNQIKEAYKAPFEVHEDILKELRKQYKEPTAKREDEIFKEIRRLYLPTPEQEDAIRRELRTAYERPSPAQEERVFRVIDRANRLPHGAVPPSVQNGQAQRIFQKLDRDADGALRFDEMPDTLRSERGRWDRNGDGFLDVGEYWAYYQSLLGTLTEHVTSGQIDLRLKRGGPTGNTTALPSPPGEKPRPTVVRSTNLPARLPPWFTQLDTDEDTQVGLYEWKLGGRPLDEFFRMDRNDDGFITVEELIRHLSQESADKANRAAGAAKSKGGSKGKER